MDDSPQLAVQLALQTLKERCQQFQDRLSELEKENVTLRSKCLEVDDSKSSLTEIDRLNRKIAELTEQKAQLKSNVMMVSAENRLLWSRLSKLMQVNKSLGSQLTKINDSLKQHNKSVNAMHSPLIRSKTFTQEEPFLKVTSKSPVEVHDKISLQLEDISLKLISSIAKEKSELEMQCSQMAEIQSNDVNITSSFGFTYSYDDVDDALVDFENHISDLRTIKELLLQNKEQIIKNIDNVQQTEVKSSCEINLEQHPGQQSQANGTEISQSNRDLDEEEKEELNSLMKWGSMENNENTMPLKSSDANKIKQTSEVDKLCPMCSKTFSKDVSFTIFQHHVESHFTIDPDSAFEML